MKIPYLSQVILILKFILSDINALIATAIITVCMASLSNLFTFLLFVTLNRSYLSESKLIRRVFFNPLCQSMANVNEVVTSFTFNIISDKDVFTVSICISSLLLPSSPCLPAPLFYSLILY